jgi:hypothetical protein
LPEHPFCVLHSLSSQCPRGENFSSEKFLFKRLRNQDDCKRSMVKRCSHNPICGVEVVTIHHDVPLYVIVVY